jgi:hypothetical protein
MKKIIRYKGILEIFISFILAFTIIVTFFKKDENFEELALGIYTQSYFAKIEGNPIHALGFRDKEKIIKGVKERGNKYVVFMLGNSQSHSLNQYKRGDVTFPELLGDSLGKGSMDVIASSVPNATIEDYYLLYNGWKQYIKMDILVIPVFLDDTREDGLRSVFYNDIKDFRLKDTGAVAAKINAQMVALSKVGSTELSGLSHTYQESVEDSLNKFLDKHFDPWHMRPNVRGDFFNNLYKLRNTVFSIDAQTKRGIIPDLYKKNIEALNALLDKCEEDKVKVLIYIPPLRNDYPMPYNENEYTEFKKEIQMIAVEHNAFFANIERAVPNRYWGFKGTRTFNGLMDIDFMHFQYSGHILVAKQLQSEIKKMIDN